MPTVRSEQFATCRLNDAASVTSTITAPDLNMIAFYLSHVAEVVYLLSGQRMRGPTPAAHMLIDTTMRYASQVLSSHPREAYMSGVEFLTPLPEEGVRSVPDAAGGTPFTLEIRQGPDRRTFAAMTIPSTANVMQLTILPAVVLRHLFSGFDPSAKYSVVLGLGMLMKYYKDKPDAWRQEDSRLLGPAFAMEAVTTEFAAYWARMTPEKFRRPPID